MKGSEASGDDSPVALPPEGRALQALVAGYSDFLAFLERRVGDRSLAEELLQEAFVRGVAKVEDLREEESAIAWFYRILRNGVVDHYRRRSGSRKALRSLAAELAVENSAPGDELRAELCRCVGHLARSLKPEYAAALSRIDVDGLAVSEFAEEEGISRSNAGVRVFRARRALRRQVELACGTCATHGCLDCSCRPPEGAGGPY